MRSCVFHKLFTEFVLKANIFTIILAINYANTWLKIDEQKGVLYPNVKATKATVCKATAWPFPILNR